MKHRKIGQQLADAIAQAIADKAFEHLIPAAKKPLKLLLLRLTLRSTQKSISTEHVSTVWSVRTSR